MSQYHVGEIILVPYNFAPAGFAECDGRLLPISENETLFNLIGTTFGGDGQDTFAVPDLRSRVPVHAGLGTGPGVSAYQLAETGGTEAVTLAVQHLPSHTHALDETVMNAHVRCQTGDGTERTPAGHVLAREAAGVTNPYSNLPADTDMRVGAIAVAGAATIVSSGSGTPHSNIQPVLGLRFCISLFGVFPHT